MDEIRTDTGSFMSHSKEDLTRMEEGAWKAFEGSLLTLKVPEEVVAGAARRLREGREKYGPFDPFVDSRDLLGKETLEEAIDVMVYSFLDWYRCKYNGFVSAQRMDLILKQTIRAARIAHEAMQPRGSENPKGA